MYKKVFLVLFLSLIILSMVSAVSMDEIIEGAKNSSHSYQNMLLSYQNSLIDLKNKEKENEDKIGIEVSGEINPLLNESKGIDIDSSVKVTLPNDGKTTITGNAGSKVMYDGSSSQTTLSLGASHTFDFSGYSPSDSSDLDYTSTKYSTQLSQKTSELTFEKTVISTVISLLNQEKNLLDYNNTLEKQRLTMDKMKTLGTYSETSAVYLNTKNTLLRLEATLASTEEQFENAKKSYKTLTGLDWEGLDDLKEPDLNLKYYENGNTSVLLKSLSAESAENSYEALYAQANPNALKVEGSTSGSMGDKAIFTLSGGASYDSKNWIAGGKISGSLGDEKSMNLSASVAYKDDNWSVSAAPGVTVNSSKAVPTLTIAGSWNNGRKASEKNDDTLTQAANRAISAQNDYASALSSYIEEAQSYSLQIISWNNSRTQTEANLSYLEMLLENERTMYSLGLSTESDVKDAEIEVQKAEYDWKIMMLNGLSLERDLAIFAL